MYFSVSGPLGFGYVTFVIDGEVFSFLFARDFTKSIVLCSWVFFLSFIACDASGVAGVHGRSLSLTIKRSVCSLPALTT